MLIGGFDLLGLLKQRGSIFNQMYSTYCFAFFPFLHFFIVIFPLTFIPPNFTCFSCFFMLLFGSVVSICLIFLSLAPRSVPSPTVVQILDGFSATVSWSPPSGDIRGLIDRYELKAYNRDQPEVPPVKVTYSHGEFTGTFPE